METNALSSTDDLRPVSLFWAVPSLVSGIVAIFAIGFVLGPIHPIVRGEVGNVIPRWLRTGAFGWMARSLPL